MRLHGALLARAVHAKHVSESIVRPPWKLTTHLSPARILVHSGVASPQGGPELTQRERVGDPPLLNEKLVPIERCPVMELTQS